MHSSRQVFRCTVKKEEKLHSIRINEEKKKSVEVDGTKTREKLAVNTYKVRKYWKECQNEIVEVSERNCQVNMVTR